MIRQYSLADVAAGVCVALVWGMGLVFAKAAMEHFPPILLMAFRFLVTSFTLIWFVRPPAGQWVPLFWISLISATIQYSLTFTGLNGLDASVTALLVQLEVPLLVIIGAVALKEQPSATKWVGIALAFFGVALIAGEPKTASAGMSVALVIGGAFAWASGQAMVRRLHDISGLTVTAWVAVLATPQLFIASFLFESDQVQAVQSAGTLVWAAVLYLGLIMTALGYALWYSLVRKHPVSQVAPFLLLLPVFSVIGAMIFLGERLTMQAMIGGAIVIGGVAIILMERRPAEVCPPSSEIL